MDVFDGGTRGFTLQPNQLVQIELRNHEAFTAGTHQETGNDGQRERNPDAQRGALARAG